MTTQPDHQAVRAQLERILASSDFATSVRHRAFLTYVVEEWLAGRGEQLKGYTLGVHVFERGPDFDPGQDPVVRIEAGRLRKALDHYYLTAGRQDALRLELPKGGYVPTVRENPEARSPAAATAPARDNAVPTIAVLPFDNRGEDPQWAHFADGLTEELSTQLARFQDLGVIGHYSSRQVADGDLRDIGQQLGADLILTGSVAVRDQVVRVNCQLTSCASGTQLWSEAIERPLTAADLYAIQDEFTARIVATVGDTHGVVPQSMAKASRGKQVEDLTAYEAVLRAHHYERLISSAAHLRAREALEHAVEIEPDYAVAWAKLALIHTDSSIYGHNARGDDLARGRACADQALRCDPLSQEAHLADAFVCSVAGQRAETVRAAERVIELNPNAAYLVGSAAWLLALGGDFERGLSRLESAMRLNANYPRWFHVVPYLAYYQSGDYDQALAEVRRCGPLEVYWLPAIEAAALAQLGRLDDARDALDAVRAMLPDFEERVDHYLSANYLPEALYEGLLAGLKKAGLRS